MRTVNSILICTTSEGHYSLAVAAQHALEAAGYAVHLFYYHEPVLNVYRIFYRSAPGWLAGMFQLLQLRWVRTLVNAFFAWSHRARLQAVLDQHQPAVVISTSFGFHPGLAQLKRQRADSKQAFRLISLIANPRTYSPLDICDEADYNLAFDTHGVHGSLSEAVSKTICPLGWLVQPAYVPAPDRAAARRAVAAELGCSPTNPLAVIVTGSEGTNLVFELVTAVRALAESRHQPVTLVVACGNNQALKTDLEQSNASASTTSGAVTPYCQVIALGFTRELHRYLQAGDLTVGKAGPNTLFESVATLTPFLATVHMPGQEDGNLDLIRELGLGWVEERTDHAAPLLLDLLADPTQLDQLQPTLRATAAYNQAAPAKLVEYVKSLLATA